MSQVSIAEAKNALTRLIHEADLLEYLVRLEEERWGHGQAERFRGLEVDDQFEPQGLLHGQVSRLGAFEDLVHKDRGAPLPPTGIRLLRPVGHQPPRLGEASVPTNHRQPMLCRQFY